MNELRWILLGFGIVLLAGIYLWGRRGAAVAEDSVLQSRPAPAQPVPEEMPDYDPRYDEESPHSAAEAARSDEHEVTAVRPANSRIESRGFKSDPPRNYSKDPPSTAPNEVARPGSPPDFRRGRVEPTLGEGATEDLPGQSAGPATPAPTLSSSDTPAPRRTERRKILALRLTSAPQRLEGAKLREVLQTELLEHGKYGAFHRLHSDGTSIFSVASMVEPGIFDLEKMAETLYPGITLFAQLPGAVPGMHALNELVACARRLQQALGGVLQDDRGVPLTVHRIERMRQEVREFERPVSTGGRPARGEGYQE